MKTGKPYVMFGDGQLASCKPISEADLASFMAECVKDPKKANQVLPIGGAPFHTAHINGVPRAVVKAPDLVRRMSMSPDRKSLCVNIKGECSGCLALQSMQGASLMMNPMLCRPW